MDKEEFLSDILDEVTRFNLLESYSLIEEQGEEPKLLKAFQKVIKYYSTPDQWEEFCNAV